MRGQPGQNTRPHSRSSASFLGMDAWMNSQLNVVLFSMLCRSLMCLFYFCHVTNGLLYNCALPDVRSTGAGIKCLYCMLLLCTEFLELWSSIEDWVIELGFPDYKLSKSTILTGTLETPLGVNTIILLTKRSFIIAWQKVQNHIL